MPAPQETIARIRHVFQQGGSAPSLAETKTGDEYVLKLRGAGGGGIGLFTELLGLRIAARIGVRVPAAQPLFLPHGFPWQAGTDEFDSMVQRSCGWNLGIAFISDAIALRDSDLAALPDDFLAALARADTLLANVDRPCSNPSILLDAQGAPWAIDFGACLFLNRILAGNLARPTAPPASHFLADRARAPEPIAIDEREIHALVQEAPEDWLHDLPVSRGELAKRLAIYFGASTRSLPSNGGVYTA